MSRKTEKVVVGHPSATLFLRISPGRSFSTATPDCDSYGRRPDVLSAIRQPSPTVCTAVLLASSRLHLCAVNCFWMSACASLGRPIVSGCRELGIAIFTHAKHRNIILSFDDPKLAFRSSDTDGYCSASIARRSLTVMELLNFVQDGLKRHEWHRWDFAVGNGQTCPGDNAVHDVFRVITVQGV